MILYILYPVLFSFIPIFTFYNKNLGEVYFNDILKLLLAAVVSITGLCLLLNKVIGLPYNITAGILLYLLIIFYTPGYKWKRFISHFWYQYVIKYLFYALLVFLIIYIDSFIPIILTILFASILVLNIIYRLTHSANTSNINIQPEIVDLSNIKEEDRPDIYHIILDAYIGSTGISAVADFDNTEFYNNLKSLGFNIYENIYSNYNHTVASIPSLFKMDYHKQQDLFETQIKINRLLEMLYSTPLMSLKKAGYKIAGYSRWFFSPQNSWIYNNILDKSYTAGKSTNGFFSNFFNMTIFGVFFSKIKSNTSNAKYVVDSLNLLKYNIDIESPLYAFFHILAPHMPFSFNTDGTINNKYNELIIYDDFQGELAQAYVNHVQYVNKLAIDAFTELINNIKNKNRKAVIVIHSDHGADRSTLYEPRYNIILAEYKYGFSNNSEKIFQDNMSLINVFPMLLNYLFNAGIELKDNKFYDEHPYNYDITDITDIINKFVNKGK